MTRNNNRTDRSSRRSVLKAMGAMTAAGFATQSVLGQTKVEPVALDPSDADPSAPRIKTAPEVKRISSNYMLLVINESSVRHYIDNSDVNPGERRKAHENLGDLRRTFPLRREKDGNLTRYKLAEGAKTHSDEQQVKKFEQVATVFANGASTVGNDVSIEHHPDHHEAMTESSGDDMGLSYDVRSTTSAYASEPDEPNVDLGVPDTIAHHTQVDDGIEDFIADVIHHVGQYYNPDPEWSYSYLCDHNTLYHDESSSVNGIGGAPYATQYHFDQADYTSGETRERWVGRLTHFPQDMGQPLHTGMAWQQANLDIKYDSTYNSFYVTINPMRWLHYGYEDFVMDYWDNSYHDFHNAYDSNNCSANYCYYETYGDGERLVHRLSDFSHQYSEKVFKTIAEENGTRDPSNWSFSTRDELSQLTRDCLHETGLWVRGCLHHYYG